MTITYELVPVPPDRAPVIGEIRYTVPLAPMPGDPLAAMIPLYPVRIIWNGTEWIHALRDDYELITYRPAEDR